VQMPPVALNSCGVGGNQTERINRIWQ
jgi:hypothetical protein